MDTMDATTKVNYRNIETEDELRELVDRCMSVSVVTIDTEFARSDTFYPIVGLIQIYDGQDCVLIDPLVLDLTPLKALLQNESVLKIFHACSEDLEVFQTELGVMPSPVFDTQVAAAVLGRNFSMSYQKLVELYLDINVPKEQTRSNWLQRPLTREQLDYAALDVIYLYQIYEKQVVRLQELGRLDWVMQECSTDDRDLPTTIEPELYFLRVKGAGSLNSEQLHRLRKLAAWRELEARENNVPRNRVVDDKSLILIAKEGLSDRAALQKKAGMTSRQIRRSSEQICQLVDALQSDSPDMYPAEIDRPSTSLNNKKIKALKVVVEDRAVSLDIAPEILATRKYLEQLVRSGAESGHYELPRGLQGWRKTVIGDELLASLSA
jgi:ribonuclease D